MSERVRVTWTGASRVHYAHLPVTPGDVRSGDFPLLCGRFAPSGFDQDVWPTDYGQMCQRCDETNRAYEAAVEAAS